MYSHGPIYVYIDHCRWLRLGPLGFPFGAADALAWAHLHLQKSLPMAPLGPINFIKEVADALAWAHLHSQEVIADGLAWALKVS